MHVNSFAERFSIAQDEARTGDLLTEILERASQNDQQLIAARRALTEATSQDNEIQELLTRKKGQVTFARLLERAGHKAFSSQLEDQIKELAATLTTIEEKISEAQADIDASKSPERRRLILDRYITLMAQNLSYLSVTSLAEKDYSRIDFPLKETGSDRPRAILAYTFAILQLIWDSSSSTRCPIVLDSPNQQDQDPDNHRRMLEFIRDFRPEGSQLVLFAVDDCGIDFGGDVQVLEEEDYLLSTALYEDTSRVINAYRTVRDLSSSGQ